MATVITLKAKTGLTPKEIIDKYHDLNKKTFDEFGIDFSIYHRDIRQNSS